ncbi:hypothetical protein AAC387_Pa03g0714 [Persea americana]
MASFPSRAPRSPPETGASTAEQPRAEAAAAISTAREGSLVVMSTTVAAAGRAERTPEGERMTERTSDG